MDSQDPLGGGQNIVLRCPHVPIQVNVRMTRLMDGSATYRIVAPKPIVFDFFPTNQRIYVFCPKCLPEQVSLSF